MIFTELECLNVYRNKFKPLLDKSIWTMSDYHVYAAYQHTLLAHKHYIHTKLPVNKLQLKAIESELDNLNQLYLTKFNGSPYALV